MSKPNITPSDPCDPLLASALANAEGPLLWIVDEHIAHPSRWLRDRKKDVTVLSNRYDSFLDAQQAGITAHFSDIDVTALATTFQSVLYRISKEKALVHRVINASKTILPTHGQLILLGGKQEGIKTYMEKAHEFLGSLVHQEMGDHSTRIAYLRNDADATGTFGLDDKDYQRFRQIGEEAGLHFYSKPGQFGWDKLDQGSQFLVAQYEQCFNHANVGRVLDLGCGYGYLALHCSRFLPESIVATDNNAAALASCRFNFEHNNIHHGSVIADDCGKRIKDRFDTILCNPPFHQGFSTSGEMTDRFIEQTRRLLRPSGQALFVVNQFIPLEQKAVGRFKSIDVFAKNKSFKLVRLRAPKP